MPSLRICELASTDTGFNAELTIETDQDHRTTYPIAIHNPFDPQTEQALEWYFEQWLNCPDLNNRTYAGQRNFLVSAPNSSGSFKGFRDFCVSPDGLTGSVSQVTMNASIADQQRI
jgi:hypothetical protein